MVIDLPLTDIFTREDGRAINQDAVDGLADSIAVVGLLNPIRVRQAGEKWEVIAGAHRVAAFRKLGMAEIPAISEDADDLHAELAMIDENLMRAELSPSDRATQTARRKAIYEELHPETVHGANQHNSSRQLGDSSERFTSDTAKVTGQSERKVQRDAERGEKVIAAAIEIIRGTALDTGTYLDKLKRLSPSEQVVAAKRDLAWHKQQERDRKATGISRRFKAVDPISDEDAKEKQVSALMSAWNKASAEARQEFLNLIDVPVFDRSAA